MTHFAPGPEGENPAAAPDENPADAPAEDVEGAEAAPSSTSFWQTVPLWAWIVAGVALVALIVTAVVVLTSRDTPEPIVLDPETVTATPTPGVDPIARTPATAFEEALPDVVLGWAVASDEISEELLRAGALEGRELTYTDGASPATTLTLLAGQWATVEAAEARLGAVVADASAESGDVTAGGATVGRYAILGGTGEATVVWTNGSAVLQLTGPADAVRDAFRGFPL